MIIIFFIMYCPSNVGKKGFPSWNVTSGKITNGKKVPVICKNIKTTAASVVFLFKKQIPIAISQYPITIDQVFADKNGIQKTVSMISLVAGETSSTFKTPNQKKIINNGILTR